MGKFGFLALLLNIFISCILLTSIISLSNNLRHLKIGIALVVPYFLTNWAYAYSQNRIIAIFCLVTGILFFSFVVYTLLSGLLTSRTISFEIIAAALSAYLMIGFGWGLIYGLIESLVPHSFEGGIANLSDLRHQFTYFSFVTLTTLGFGDISPTNPISQSWTILEAIIGQIYLVVIISGLVGIFVSAGDKKR